MMSDDLTISADVVGDIIYFNIKTVDMLREESL
jgi:hypothetical protein